MLDIRQRLEEIERQNAKTKKKEEEDYTYSKKGCERQVKFNNKVKDIAIDQMRVELTKLLGVLPDKISDLIKKGEKELDDGNHVLKVADKFGFKAAEEFVKEELARNAEEEKKIKRFRKELTERQGKMRNFRGARAATEATAGAASGASAAAARASRAGSSPAPTRTALTRASPRMSGASTARGSGTWLATAPRRTCPRPGSRRWSRSF